MRRADQRRYGAGGQRGYGSPDLISICLDEAGVVEELGSGQQRWRIVHGRSRSLSVSLVLTTAGIAAKGASDKDCGVANSAIPHLRKRVWQQRVPITIAQKQAQRSPTAAQFGLNMGGKPPVAGIGRAGPAQLPVVFCYLEFTRLRHAAPAQHIIENRDDVFAALGTAEGLKDDCVELGHWWSSLSEFM